MALPTEPPAGQRIPLSRERVLAAAVELADSGGVAALTMRKLAQRLGVEAMSLYHHVANKSALLDGLVDTVFAEIELPGATAEAGTSEPSALDWKDAMRRRALSARDVLGRHPWATALMESRTSPGAATLRHHDAVLGILRRAGFPVAATAAACSPVSNGRLACCSANP